MRRLLKKVLLLSLLWCGGSVAWAAETAPRLAAIQPTTACDTLQEQDFSSSVGTSVTITKTETLKTTQGTFCKVTANIAPEIGVEVALPVSNWTQRFLQVGCGGLCGNINLSLSNASGCVPAMNGEFAVAATNMGHSTGMMDGTWAEDPQKRIDFAYRANHLTALLAKALITAWYGQSPKYSYFMGCSDGGREALMEAQRYPDDFDGISAGAPAAFFQFQNSFYHGWNVAANLRKDGSAILLKASLPVLHAAVVKNCPTLSDVKDGILQNPYACTFSDDWVTLCKANQKDKSACLTQEELDVAKKLYRGAYDEKGAQFVASGLPLGSELRWPVPDSAKGHSMSEMMVLPALQSVLLPGGKQPIQSMSDFPLTQQNFDAVAQLAPLYNAANTNLSAYEKRGGKLMMWHGLADDSVTPAFSIAYYRGVQSTLGEATTDKFLRLFLLPGVGHCGGGDGYDQVDLLTPLMAWTEHDMAPQSLMTGKLAAATSKMPSMPPMAKPDAQAQFHGIQKKSEPFASPAAKAIATRPVFPYPMIARYNGTGSVNDASNYSAVKSDEFARLTLRKPASDFIGPDNQKNYVVRDGQLAVE